MNNSYHDDQAAESIDEGSNEPIPPDYVLELDEYWLRKELKKKFNTEAQQLQDHHAVVQEYVEAVKKDLRILKAKIRNLEGILQEFDKEVLRLIDREHKSLFDEIMGTYQKEDMNHTTPMQQEAPALRLESQSSQSTILSAQSLAPLFSLPIAQQSIWRNTLASGVIAYMRTWLMIPLRHTPIQAIQCAFHMFTRKEF